MAKKVADASSGAQARANSEACDLSVSPTRIVVILSELLSSLLTRVDPARTVLKAVLARPLLDCVDPITGKPSMAAYGFQ